jgi:hypothetical protein
MRNAPADTKAMKRSALAAALGGAALLTGASAQALRLPAASHCPVFPANNAWNQRVDKLPVSADSTQLISAIGLDATVHADFGSGKWDGGPIGIPFDVVSATTPTHRVSFPNDQLHSLGRLTGADFDVVDTSSLPEPGK